MTVRFLLDGEVIEHDGTDPTETVLDMLRYRLRRTGTKEGCAEGDCGACTVLLGELEEGKIAWRAVNACILFVPMLDGRALFTVESLSQGDALHPVQQAMAEKHASQCGFCTPGFVMSLYGRAISARGTTDATIEDVLAGNLCRCTGYGPIIEAGEANPPGARDNPGTPDDEAILAGLKKLAREKPLELTGKDTVDGSRRTWYAPSTAGQMADYLTRHPDAQILAGATDVGLWVTKQHRQMSDIVWLGEVAQLRAITQTEEGLTLGAGVRYTDAADALGGLHRDLAELVRRIGGLQVRNSGTIGGNIANGSPIGDMPPALIALGAILTLRSGDTQRTMPLEAFFLEYGKQDRQAGEFVESVFVPRPGPSAIVRIVKLSKRFASDISAVLGAVHIVLEGNTVKSARIAFGGMAGTPQRAAHAEAALVGHPFDERRIGDAAAALKRDFSPMTDQRGTAQYRLHAAANVLRKVWREHASPQTAHSLSDLEHAHG